MFKRFVVSLFVLSAFVTPVHAKETVSYPSWVDRAWSEGHRCKRWEKLIRDHGLPVKPFSYICWRESRGNPKSWNRHDPHSGSYGLFQINGSWTSLTAEVCRTPWGDRTALWEPGCNVRVARVLWLEDGFGPWGW